MNKAEIIEYLANAGVPEGTVLVERDLPGIGLTVATVTAGNVGGLHIMAARMFAQQLAFDTAGFPDRLTPELLSRLHRSSKEFHENVVAGATFEAVREEARETYEKVVKRLREVAVKHGIQYEEPE